jgi:L-alanine-DL-glutamate epimerase-like enolase superfamily enzyme
VRIVRAELAMLRIPLRTPFRTALRTVERAEDVVLRLHADDGRIGYGSAPATPQITGDTHASIIADLRERLLPLLLDREPSELPALLAALQDRQDAGVSARAAAEVALHDLAAQERGQPLFRYLGGTVATLSTDLTISVDALPKMLSDVREALGRGFSALKIKLGKDADEDIERVRAIAQAVEGRATLRLDANQGWSPEQAIRVMLAVEAAGIRAELLEQPVGAKDLDGLARVAAAIRTPVMADESVFGPDEVEEIARRRAARIVNIKLVKAAGIGPALAIAQQARTHGLECMMGCMLEGPIGVAAAAHVAAACADVVTRVDLDGPSLCRFDPVASNVSFDGPAIRLGEAPGLGITAIRGLEPIDG